MNFYYLCHRNRTFMIIREELRRQIEDLKEGTVTTVADFDIPRQHRQALIKALSQYVENGILKKVSKGRYYKPRQTRFGEVKPPISEIVKDLLVKDGKVTGYLTAGEYFSAMGLTTQITSSILIGTSKYHRPIRRDGYDISFILQPNPLVPKDFDLFRILDAIKLIRKIPAATPDESVVQLGHLIKSLDEEKRQRMLGLVRPYPPFVRALLGAILEQHQLPYGDLKVTLNPLTTYKLPISTKSLPAKNNWNII